MTDQRWFHKRGSLSDGPWESVLDASTSGLEYCGIRIANVAAGDRLALPERGVERMIIPLSGSFYVSHRRYPDETFTSLEGRSSVFNGPTDLLYLGANTSIATIQGEGRVAVAEARTDVIKPWRHVRAGTYPVELRGAGRASRQVHNYGTPAAVDAARLIVCEVITPAENWSSYPPHKHDQYIPGHESQLEEIYYFESAPTDRATAPMAAGDSAFGLFSTYASPAADIEINAMVHTGDIAAVPHGYHGPAVAAPGYDLYYLNVMAGPDLERVWLISDDPAHAWIRDTWTGQDVDPRLPYTRKAQH